MRMLLIIIIAIFCTGFCWSDNCSTGPAVLSISSDGRYIISGHLTNKMIILWDTVNKSIKTISTNGNIYSVYFIKHSSFFMWQDLNNTVHIQNAEGKEVLSFQCFPTYGEVMSSDVKHYFAADVNWSIASGFGKVQKYIKPYAKSSDGNFLGYLKLLNLTLANDDRHLLSSGFGSPNSEDNIVWWETSSGKPTLINSENHAKTIATISPDGKYIVAGDENMGTYVWDAKTGRNLLELDDLVDGRRIILPHCDYQKDPVMCEYFDKDNIIAPPFGYDKTRLDATFALKFIDLQGHYLRFITDKPYAILYSVNDRRPIKYFHLDQWPATVNMSSIYARDEAIDTAPEANLLVVGQRYNAGIIVYKYDPEKMTLNKRWAPTN
jgi:WD40 repeat protein